MNGVLEGIEKVVVETQDGKKIIAIITEDGIDTKVGYRVRMKPVIPEHKLFISCPMKGRTEENIKKSFEVMQRIAEAYTGETLEVVNPYIPKNPCGNADRIRYLADSINLMAGADYFIAPTDFWKYRECAIEEGVADKYGLKCLFADSEFATPDVPEHERPVCDH